MLHVGAGDPSSGLIRIAASWIASGKPSATRYHRMPTRQCTIFASSALTAGQPPVSADRINAAANGPKVNHGMSSALPAYQGMKALQVSAKVSTKNAVT